MTQKIIKLQNIASQVRRDIIRQTSHAQSGHPGGSLGCADFLTVLYFDIMKHDPEFDMMGHNQDVFFLSNGHISPVWYSVLARSGYFPVSELKTFRNINSRLQGHPTTHEGLPGVRVASGSLGQGLSVAVGMAMSKRIDRDPGTVFVLTGDGELQEGQNWEAIMSASHYKLNNLVAVVDVNGQQIDGPNEEVMSLGDLKAKWKSFGWQVYNMDGHDIKQMMTTLKRARKYEAGPVCILMKTEMGKGVDFMEGTHHWHGKAPNADQTEKALAQLHETLGDF